MKTNGFDWLAILLAVLGAVTWGILGVTGLMDILGISDRTEPANIVALALEPIFRPGPAQTVEYFIYVLVGAAGFYLLYTAYKMGRASRRTTRERRRDATPETARPETTTDYADADAENTNTES